MLPPPVPRQIPIAIPTELKVKYKPFLEPSKVTAPVGVRTFRLLKGLRLKSNIVRERVGVREASCCVSSDHKARRLVVRCVAMVARRQGVVGDHLDDLLFRSRAPSCAAAVGTRTWYAIPNVAHYVSEASDAN